MARERKVARRRSASARALADARYRLRIARNRKRYTRKGRAPQGRGPFDSRRARARPTDGGRARAATPGRLALAVVAGLFLALAGAEARAAQDDPRLDGLFERLRATSDSLEARSIQNRIWTIWLDARDDTLDGLMRGGVRAMRAGDLDGAIDRFTRLIEAAPTFAEAWNKRATVYYMAGRHDESIADCMKTIELEPRHFGALSGLGLIHGALDDDEAALFWFREALRRNPHMETVRRRIEALSREIEGEPI